MKTPARLAAVVATTALALLAPAAAQAAQVKDVTGDVTGMNGAKPSNSASFQALVPSVDITKVKAQKVGKKVVVTVDVVDLPDVEDGSGPLIAVELNHNGPSGDAFVGYYTASNPIFGEGVQSACGATGKKDVIANRVTVTFPKKCFAKATKVTSVWVNATGYDGKTTDLPEDEATLTRAFSVKTKK